MRTLLLLLSLVAVSSAQAAEDEQPNVLLVTIDDLNDWVGALGGHPQAHTPNLDALAQRAVLFSNAHCQAPVCTPSRASLFTGRLPSSTGMYFLQPALAQAESLSEVETLSERFARAGYETLGVGKLVHGGGERDYFQTYGGGLGGFGPSSTPKLHYPEGHPLWDWGAYREADGVEDADMPDARIADWATARLAEPREQPFLLAVGFWRPHVPMCVPASWFERVGAEDEIELPAILEDDAADLSDYARALTIGHPAPRHEWMRENDAWRPAVHAYLASCAFVDHQLGRVLDALEAGPHARTTIVVLLSDHGFHLGEKGRWAKRSLWEQSTRVPLLVAAPGIDAGVSPRPAGLVDVYPTLLELCGLRPDAALDGHSLVPLLHEPTRAWPHAALTSFGPGNHAVRTTRWRYVRYADGSEELYDHAADPEEWRNLAGAPEHGELIERLRGALPKHDSEPVPGASGSGFDAWRAAEAGRQR